jgi:SGNH domain (fused to AT3 domains)
VPQLLNNYVPDPPEVDRTLREIAARYGATYISASQTLCSAAGCLVRVGDNPGDIVQFDDNHFSESGSLFLVRRIAGIILDSKQLQASAASD